MVSYQWQEKKCWFQRKYYRNSEVKISIVTPIWRGKINQSIVNKKLKCKSHFGQQGKKEI